MGLQMGPIFTLIRFWTNAILQRGKGFCPSFAVPNINHSDFYIFYVGEKTELNLLNWAWKLSLFYYFPYSTIPQFFMKIIY